MKNADMPAMPMFSDNAEPCIVLAPETGVTAPATGLTKREMMAMHILSGLLAAPDMSNATPDQLTVAGVLYADKLLQELGRTSK